MNTAAILDREAPALELSLPASRGVVLVGADLSSSTREAIARAVQIGRANEATVEIVQVASPLSLEAIHAIAADLRAAKLPVGLRVLPGDPLKGLRDAARELHATLVVVGSRGRLVTDVVLGSTAERLARLARVPVLLVRRPSGRGYRRVVVAVDRRSDVMRAIRLARFVAPEASLELVHVCEGLEEAALVLDGASTATVVALRREARREARAALAASIAAAGIDERDLVFRHGDLRFVLASEAQSPDGLVILERRGSIAHRLVLGSTAGAVIANGTSDVLLL
jgi:universal stress protein E